MLPCAGESRHSRPGVDIRASNKQGLDDGSVLVEPRGSVQGGPATLVPEIRVRARSQQGFNDLRIPFERRHPVQVEPPIVQALVCLVAFEFIPIPGVVPRKFTTGIFLARVRASVE